MIPADTINRMLEACAKDLASRRPNTSLDERRRMVRRSIGLEPLPPRTPLNARVTGIERFDGYRVDKVEFESRPGVYVTANLYLPDEVENPPVVVCPHGHWEFKKSDPCIQAPAISLALYGIAAFVIDSPGYSYDQNEMNERATMGPHDDRKLSMGLPIQGVYAWDVMRAIDYLETRTDVDSKRVGATGASGGGTTIVFLAGIETRLSCIVTVCAASSMEVQPHTGCLCNNVAGILRVGDRPDVMAIGAPTPIMLIGAHVDPEFPPEAMREAFEKLRKSHSSYRSEDNLRIEIIESGHDYNRRMREAMLAFMLQHLKGEPKRGYVAEKRPITDGHENPWPANTLDGRDDRLLVNAWDRKPSQTFREMSRQALIESYPEPYDVDERVIRWGRYGALQRLKTASEITLVEAGSDSESTIVVSPTDLDFRTAIYLGVGLPELLAQILHLTLPGVPEGWERTGLAGDAVTAMIASMRTLVSKAEPEEPVSKITAHGPFASFVGAWLGVYRPELEVDLSHPPTSWVDVFDGGGDDLVQPGARYLQWPFASRK